MVSTNTIINPNYNELARKLRHEGIRAGEIIAYRAWRVIDGNWFRDDDARLHSVAMRNYVWHLDKPASGDRDWRHRRGYGYDRDSGCRDVTIRRDDGSVKHIRRCD